MTSSRLFRSLKSGIAVLTSGSMLVVSAVSPVAAQTYRAVPGAGGSSARAIAAPVSSIPSLPASVVGSAGARFGLTTAPSAPAALSNAGPAALNDDAKDAASQPAAAVKPQSAGAANAGPRWVAHREDAPKRTGPRWVAPKAPGLRAALFKILPFLGDRPGDETFDGAARQPKSIVDAPAEAPAPEAGARLSPARAQARIIEDHSIATPEAARRVGALRHAHGAPAWVKVAAPVSLLAAAAVAVYSGAALTVPVLTLGAGLVLSVLAHEVAHVAMLRRLGDRTAEHAGSHSLNPFHHIDGVKTVLAPALSLALSSLLLPFPVLIGAGKPVDADFNNLRGIFGGPRSARNAFWVAAAGPATNILLAGAAYGAFALLPAGGAMAAVAFGLAKMNLALTVFNLLPFPQLDGGKMLASALPERFYAKWVFNPKVEKTYQGILRRLYQGPSNILTWLADRLGVRTQTGINRLANATTFAALAAFYAVAYFQFSVSVPLLFLALPCSYDYWCIREKVRSEAAVNSLMGIMGEWGSLISQISREKGLESEVSAYEAEHAMKNALETLVDEMMAKPEFRALPDADKLEAFMKAYPEKAAEYLREKAITEDSLEQIRAILSDPRNGPFYERLKKWFTEHEIFSRWDNAHDKEKLKDALDEADKPKESGIGGAAALAIVALGLGALGLGMGFPGWAPQASALLGGIGAFGMLGALGFSAPDPSDGREKVAADTAVENNQVIVRFKAAAEQVDVDRVTRLLAPVRGANAPELERAGTITAESQEKALQIAALAAPDAAVESIAVSAEAFRAFNSVPWQQKIVGTSFPNTTLRVIFASPMAQEQAETFLASYGRPTPVSDRAYTIYGADAETIAEMARALADDHRVTKIMVSGLVQSRLTGIPAARQNVPEPVAGGLTPDASMPAAAAPAPVPAQPPAWFGKAVRKHSLTESVRVVFASGTSVGDMRARLQGYPRAQSLGGVAWEIPVLPARAAAVARHFAEEASVIKIILSPAAYAQLKRAAANPAEPSAPEEEPEAVPQTPSEAPTPQAPAAPVPAGQPDFTKVFLRGGENGALNVLFKENVPTARREEILALSGGESVASDVRSGGEDVLSYEGGVEVRDAVVLLSKFSEVEALGVSLFNYETLVDHRARAIDNARRKIVLRAGMRDLEIRVVLRQSVAASLAEEMMNVYRWTRVYEPEGLAYVAQIDDAAKMARLASHFAQDPRIVKVVAPKGFEIPGARVDEAASFAPMNATSHGKAEYAQNVVFVKFAAGTPESVVKMILAKHGQNVLYYHGDQLTVHTPSAQAAAAKAVALSAEPTIESVQVHANALALLTGEAPPQSDAQDYDPGRGLLVQFKEDVSPEQIREYAETRRLKLINPEFRGAARLVLLETLNAEDFNDTARLLAAERSGIVASIEPLLARPDLVLAAPAAPAAAEPVAEAVAAPRRDPAAAWIDWLQNVTLSDGKSKLTDDQIHMLSALLRPVAKSSDEARAPIVSRNEEVKRMLPIVTAPRGMRNSVILIGEAGVGKTAVAEGLAEMIEDSEHAVAGDKEAFLRFQRLQGRWLVELDINAVLNQKDPVGVMTELLNMLPRLNSGTASRGNDVIVLMDEIQKLLLDKSLGPKMGNALKGPLRDGKISVIATTTGREYKEYIESDDALRRRFEKIDIAEPTVEQTISILRAMKGWLQRLHDAVFPDEALVAAAKLADQFDKTNFNPDKAIKAVQDAGELSRPENLRAAITLDLRDTWGQLFVAVNEARQALVDKGIASTLALPVDLYNKIAGLVQKAESLYVERESVADGQGQVSVEVVKRVIAAKTGIGSGQLSLGEDDASRYVQMEAEVGKRVVNQDGALTAIANAVRRNKSGLSNPNRPMGKFLLTGPTGVGKTYLAKELARFLFNDPNAMIRLDMSEYMEEHTAQRMTGSPPGYVGHEAGGQLTEAVRKKPYSVILFDEIEKAHPKVFDVLLQILDDGRLTDGQGRTVDFKNTVIILTSNAGMSEVGGEKYAELLAKVEAHNQAQRDEINKTWDAEIDMLVAASLKKRFRPEFLNRLDEDPLSKNKWIRVNRLRPEDIAKIASLQLKEFQQLLADRHDTDIQFDQSVIDYLSVEGYSPLYGARPMTAAIEKNIIDPMAKWILEEANEGKKNVRGGRISVGYAEGRITFTASAKPPKNTPRATVQGATEIVTAELFKLIEGLAGVGEGEEPTSELFDRLMRKARPAATAAAAGSAGERTKAFFVPGGALEVLAPATPLEHNAAKKKDAAARAAIAATREAAAAAKWPEAVLNALEAPAGQVGEGWIKQIVRLAKEQAAKAGASAPIAVAASVDEHAIRVSVSGAHQLTEDDQRRLLAHFTGAPPQSYLEAQKKADRLNLNARMLWDHQLLDLYGRLSAIPGARMGFSNDAHGSQIWLEIKHEKAAAAPAPAVSAAAAAERKITPHQNREMAKTRDLLMRYIDQSHLKQSDQDGHAIRIAAVESFARLAAPADAALAREWIAAKGWGKALEGKEEDSSEPTIVVGTDWPLAMAAAMILERFGGAEDVEILENVSRRVMGSSHYEVPVHNALVSALSTLYARLGLDVTRKACERAAQITKVGRSADMADASKRALGSVGLPIDAESIKLDADGHVAMAKRLGRQEELLKIFRDNGMWGAMSSRDSVRQAALKLAGELETSEEALTRLKNMMKTQTSYSRTAYEMSRAWAAIAARLGRTKGLGEAITRHLEQFDLDEYHASSKHWTLLLAYVEAARLAGGADELQPLERLMSQPPNDVNSLNEQAYFTAPDAWAQALVRSGRFEEYARSQGLSNGAPRPSKLQEMLMSKDRPMLVAAALRAIAYARDPLTSKKPIKATGPLPVLHPEKTVS